MKQLSLSTALALVIAAGCTLLPLAAHSGSDTVSNLIDLPGSKWREKPADTSLLIKHTGLEPYRLTVHFTDVKKNYERPLTEKLRILFNYSTTKIEGTKKHLWGDVPYHFFIDANGKVGEGRSTIYQPDTNTYYKRDGHITIVIEGDATDGITLAQKRRLFSLLDALRNKFNVPIARVGMHKDYAQTDCPGPAVSAVVKEYLKSRGGSEGPHPADSQPPGEEMESGE